MWIRMGTSRSGGVVVGVARVVDDPRQLLELAAQESAASFGMDPELGYVLVTKDASIAERLLPFNSAIQAIVADCGGDDLTIGHPSIPIVADIEDATSEIVDGDLLIVEGFRGIVISNPSLEVISKFQQIMQYRSRNRYRLEEGTDTLQSLDGHTVRLFAHLSSYTDLTVSQDAGADGVYLDGSWVVPCLSDRRWIEKLIGFVGGRGVTLKMPSSLDGPSLDGIMRLSEELTVTAVFGSQSMKPSAYKRLETNAVNSCEQQYGICLSRPVLSGCTWQPGDESIEQFDEANSLWVDLPPVSMLDKLCASQCLQQNQYAQNALLTRMGVTGAVDPSVFGVYLGLGYSDLCMPMHCILPCKRILPMVSVELARQAVSEALDDEQEVNWSDLLDRYRILTQ